MSMSSGRAKRGELRDAVLREVGHTPQTTKELTYSIYGRWDERHWKSIAYTVWILEKSGHVVRDRSTSPSVVNLAVTR